MLDPATAIPPAARFSAPARVGYPLADRPSEDGSLSPFPSRETIALWEARGYALILTSAVCLILMPALARVVEVGAP